MSTGQQQVESQLWTIERVIAFVVAPIVTPLSGFVAAWLAKHGIHVKGDAIYGYAATVSAGTAASFITWLVGRWKFTRNVATLEGRIGEIAAPIFNVIPASERASLLKDVEDIVAAHAAKLAAKIVPGQKIPGRENMGMPAVASTPLEVPSADPWDAPNDPAPATPPPEAETPAPLLSEPPGGQAETPAPGTAADAGAVIQGS